MKIFIDRGCSVMKTNITNKGKSRVPRLTQLLDKPDQAAPFYSK
jgi:hypothetical protein